MPLQLEVNNVSDNVLLSALYYRNAHGSRVVFNITPSMDK